MHYMEIRNRKSEMAASGRKGGSWVAGGCEVVDAGVCVDNAVAWAVAVLCDWFGRGSRMADGSCNAGQAYFLQQLVGRSLSTRGH